MAHHFASHRVLACAALLVSSLAFQTKPTAIPPAEEVAKAALDSSPRHGEWVDIAVPGSKTPLKSWIVYPEVKDKAPVVIIIHEIFGESDWIRSVADQLAADGFIAIAPDLLSGYGPNAGGTDSLGGRDAVTAAIRKLQAPEVCSKLDAVREYGLSLPSATKKSAVIGFCWGGGMAFSYAMHQKALSGAIACYGTNPTKPADAEKIACPLLGLYGGNDNRVTSTVAPFEALMAAAHKPYTTHIYEGAGHGFLRQQSGQNGANLKAADQAWPAITQFLRANTN